MWCICLPKVTIVVSLAQFEVKRCKGCMDFILRWILSSNRAAHIMQVEVQWHVLEGLLVYDSTENARDAAHSLE